MVEKVCKINIVRVKLIIFFVIFLYGIACTNDGKENIDKNIGAGNDTTVFQFAYPSNSQSIEDSLSYYFGLSEISPLKGDSLIRFFVYGDSAYLVIDLDRQNYKAKVIQFLAEGNGVDGFLKISKIEERMVDKNNLWWHSLDSLLFNRNIYGLQGEYSRLSTGGYSVCIQQRFLNIYCSSVIDNPEYYLNRSSDDFIDKDDIIRKNVALTIDFLFKDLSIKSKMFENLR